MFGKSKSIEGWKAQSLQGTALPRSATALQPMRTTSSLSSEMTVVGKIICKDVIKIHGLVEGEVNASNALIANGARIQGDVVAEELTVAGRVRAIFMRFASSCRVLPSSRVTFFTGRYRSTNMRVSKDARGRRVILASRGRAPGPTAQTHSLSPRR
jgi:cytoskeletal protein CcmA (bactofilin family)